jgi:hypothetical protein
MRDPYDRYEKSLPKMEWKMFDENEWSGWAGAGAPKDGSEPWISYHAGPVDGPTEIDNNMGACTIVDAGGDCGAMDDNRVVTITTHVTLPESPSYPRGGHAQYVRRLPGEPSAATLRSAMLWAREAIGRAPTHARLLANGFTYDEM